MTDAGAGRKAENLLLPMEMSTIREGKSMASRLKVDKILFLRKWGIYTAILFASVSLADALTRCSHVSRESCGSDQLRDYFRTSTVVKQALPYSRNKTTVSVEIFSNRCWRILQSTLPNIQPPNQAKLNRCIVPPTA